MLEQKGQKRLRPRLQAKSVRSRGIKPRSVPWEGTKIPLHQLRLGKEPIRQPTHNAASPPCHHAPISHTPSLYCKCPHQKQFNRRFSFSLPATGSTPPNAQPQQSSESSP
ncbi:uncharacterized protein [Physcomitrium patens]|uniref:Uncharacterized protein n=1 Tax=Physcomitrium patens TaxID=3218 RepID=A0A2K1JTE3_PHYPA|nr:hypothetical protein PHYPA_014568 [Physcomitrium patens]